MVCSFYMLRSLHILPIMLPFDVHTTIAQEPGWSSKDQDVTLVHKLGDGLCGLIGGHICHNMFHERVLEHQDICNLGLSIWLHGCLILVKSMCKISIGVVDTIRCRGTLDKLAASNARRTLWISAPGWSFLATRSILATRTV